MAAKETLLSPSRRLQYPQEVNISHFKEAGVIVIVLYRGFSDLVSPLKVKLNLSHNHKVLL